MFTGLVEETGTVVRIQPSEKSIRLTVRAKVCGRGLKVSQSLAVNGCCLTVVKVAAKPPLIPPLLVEVIKARFPGPGSSRKTMMATTKAP